MLFNIISTNTLLVDMEPEMQVWQTSIGTMGFSDSDNTENRNYFEYPFHGAQFNYFKHVFKIYLVNLCEYD